MIASRLKLEENQFYFWFRVFGFGCLGIGFFALNAFHSCIAIQRTVSGSVCMGCTGGSLLFFTYFERFWGHVLENLFREVDSS